MKAKTVIKEGIIQTLCRQCDIRCAINVHIENGAIVDITGFDGHPQNRGSICIRGLAAKDLFYHKDRLLTPLKKTSDNSFVEIGWDQAFDEIAQKITDIKKKYGASAMGVWKGEALGYFQQEEYARRFIHAFGSPNYFSNDSACFNGRYLGYKLVCGFFNGSPAYEHADLIILWATNPPVSHPPAMREISDSLKRGCKLIVVDHRNTKIAGKAHIFARPIPGTDGALAWGIIRHLIETNNYDLDFLERYAIGFEEFSRYAMEFDPEFVERHTGVGRQTLVEMAEMIVEKRPKVVLSPGVGLEHHDNGVNTVRTLACLQCLCGGLDTEGSITWPEFMRVRRLTLYDDLPHQEQKPIGADKFPVLYDLRRECHSMTAMESILGNHDYPLKGLIITAANPAITNPNSVKVTKALSSLDLLVVNDLFLTETARLAHYVLPAPTFLERSELHYHPRFQRVTLSRKIAEIQNVYDEYTLWRTLSHRLGFGERYFPWKNEEAVNHWILEPTGFTVEDLLRHPEGVAYAPIRYKKYETRSFPTPSGKIEFCSQYLKERGFPELPEYVSPYFIRHAKPDYPFILTTGARKSLYYHSRFRNISRFKKVNPAAEVEIHPADAARLGIENKERVRIISEIGSIVIQTKVLPETGILPGVVEVAHGWEEANVNLLTHDTVNDPISGFPLLKGVPVRIEKV